MAGDSGKLIRTVDGGANWSVVSLGKTDSIDVGALDGLSENIVFAGITRSDTSHILRTTNGGCFWEAVSVQPGGRIHGIKMFNSTIGVAVGDPVGGKWTVLKTSDGGGTWSRFGTEPPQFGSSSGGNGFAAFDSSSYWFFDNYGRQYMTWNGGTTWYLPDSTFQATDARRYWMNDRVAAVYASPSQFFGYAYHGWVLIPGPRFCGPFPLLCPPISGLTGVRSTAEFWVVQGYIYHLPGFGETWTSAPPHGLAKDVDLIDMVTLGSTASGWATGTGDTVYHYQRVLTGVGEVARPAPGDYSLAPNYPNPFNPTTTFRYAVPTSSHVSLRIYNLIGVCVATLVDKNSPPGNYEVSWDAVGFPSGVYFCRFEGGRYSDTKKLLLVR
jgi:hypothetical protein